MSDEPYAHYLQATQLDHPARDEVVAASSRPTGGASCAALTESPVPGGQAVWYQNMTHHLLPGMDTGWVHALPTSS